MSDAQLSLTIARPHNNRQLFSDHYLNEVLPRQHAWIQLLDESAATLQSVSAILAAYKPSANEAQTERELIHPVLAVLGHDFEVQPPLKTSDGSKRPDYVFYRSVSQLNANKGRTLDDNLPKEGGFAVGDAKYWDRPLDLTLRATSADPFTNKNPSFQIAFYMQHSGVEWGLLTNGRLWRLYHKDTAHKLDRFYEVDLPALVEAEDPGAFLYFFAFFRRPAFDEQPLGLAKMLRESVDYARSVGDSLKTQVFDALLHLAQGFLDYRANSLHADEATLKVVYENSLIVLYRLLFILYAEDRDLLPVRDQGMYREAYSLYAIKRSVAADLDGGRHLLPTSSRLWTQLTDLFHIIDSGSPPLHVSTFNGGLFDSNLHPFVERNIVGDYHIQRAIDSIARVDKQFVDYRDLAVRHLGTIYEGLLEHHLSFDNDAMAPLQLDLTSHSQPKVCLVNANGERKLTGSYYTPDYVVNFMVDHTIGPILNSAVVEKRSDALKIEGVLGINVLDPAMGSGHFLVEATEYMARYLVDLAVLPEGDTGGEADLGYWKRRVVQSCIYGVDINPLAVELAKLSLWLTTAAKGRPLSFLDHHLRTGNALVGARLGDLQRAQPAAKKRSNGAVEKQEAAGQVSMFAGDDFRQSMSLAVGNMWLIEKSASRTVTDVKQQETLYSSLRAAFTSRYGRLADLVTATHFGVTVDQKLWQPLADFATGRTLTTLPEIAAQLEAAELLAARHHFFHWELEFPEVFFDRFGRPLETGSGFDVVIGNPPYVRQEQLTPYKPYFATRYDSYHGVADLYLYFFEQGLRLAHEGGRMAFISSGTFARANFASAFRKLLPTLAQLEAVIDFGENQPFEGAEMVRPSIVVLQRGLHASQFRSLFISDAVPDSLDDALASDGVDCDAATLLREDWTFQVADRTQLFSKIYQTGRRLIDLLDGKLYRGVVTGLNDAFIINDDTRAALIRADASANEIIKPFLQGEDLRPWYQEHEGRWLIFTRRGIPIDDFPSIRDYLQQFRERLEPRPAPSHGADAWPGRKPGPYKWYEIQDSVDYFDVFSNAIICWPDISKLPRFSRTVGGNFIANTGYVAATPDASLLALLQSRVLWFAISQVCQPLRLRAGLWQYRTFSQYISRLPIPEMSREDRIQLERLALAITAQAQARYSLHTRSRHRILADLGVAGKRLNNRLTTWWDLDIRTLRAEVRNAFRVDIPLKQRDDWETWLGVGKAEHAQLTDEIIRLETELNERVYALFQLTPDDIEIVESETKYRYGEV